MATEPQNYDLVLRVRRVVDGRIVVDYPTMGLPCAAHIERGRTLTRATIELPSPAAFDDELYLFEVIDPSTAVVWSKVLEPNVYRDGWQEIHPFWDDGKRQRAAPNSDGVAHAY